MMQTWRGVQGVVPLVQYDDGAWFGRLVDDEGFVELVVPAWRRQPGHWTTVPFSEGGGHQKDNPMFVYVDSEGETQAIVMISDSGDGVLDMGGPGLGRITDPVARARVLGILFEAMFPDKDNPIHESRLIPQNIPMVISDRRFNRSMTGPGTQFYKVRKDPSSTPMDLLEAAKALVKAKSLKLHSGFKFSRSVAHPMRERAPEEVLWFIGFVGVVSNAKIALEYDASQDLWRVVIFYAREGTPLPGRGTNIPYNASVVARPQELEVLGTSKEGAFEALVDAGMYLAESNFSDWIEANTQLGGNWRYDPEPYILLDAPDPMLLPHEEFTAFASALPEDW